jgi:transcriptional regulator with XRE-family HTH domain
MELGSRVRIERRRRGLTQSELGHPLSRSYISALENGSTLPSLGTLWLLSDRLGVSVAELIDGATGCGRQSYTPVNGSQTEDDEAHGPRPT